MVEVRRLAQGLLPQASGIEPAIFRLGVGHPPSHYSILLPCSVCKPMLALEIVLQILMYLLLCSFVFKRPYSVFPLGNRTSVERAVVQCEPSSLFRSLATVSWSTTVSQRGNTHTQTHTHTFSPVVEPAQLYFNFSAKGRERSITTKCWDRTCCVWCAGRLA